MMNDKIIHITAVTEVGPQGQKCIETVLEYDRELPKELTAESYIVEKRTVTGITVEGRYVRLALSPDDEDAATYHQGNPWEHIQTWVGTASVSVRQAGSIMASDGTVIPPFGPCNSDQTANRIVDDFIQGEFEGLKYNLYIPRECTPGEKYPLVQFIHDAAPCGSDARLTLTQGIGAIVWARPEEQKKRKCFVLAPQFDGTPIVDDDGNVDPRLETAKRLLDQVCRDYEVDQSRIYTTGQSMGCMSSIVLNVRYPELFAASFLVAGQWNEREIQGLEKQKIWMINSMGDAKAFPGMNQMACEMESKGAVVARRIIDARASQKEFFEIAKELTETGANIIYTPYDIESVAEGWHSRGGAHHTSTWKTAYEIEAIREWLFSNSR